MLWRARSKSGLGLSLFRAEVDQSQLQLRLRPQRQRQELERRGGHWDALLGRRCAGVPLGLRGGSWVPGGRRVFAIAHLDSIFYQHRLVAYGNGPAIDDRGSI